MLQHPKIANNALLQDSAQVLVRNSVFLVSDDCLQSVIHSTDEILHSGQKIDLPRYSEDDVRVPSVFAALGWHK